MNQYVEHRKRNLGAWTLIGFLFLIVLIIMNVVQPLWAAEDGNYSPEINSKLMEATFRIDGKDKLGRGKVGTVFLVTMLLQDNPQKGRFVLVTAAHVLQDIVEDFAILHLRTKTEADAWTRVPFQLREGLIYSLLVMC